MMPDDLWESRYLDVYDSILLNSDIYLAVRDMHVNAMAGCARVLDSGCGTGNVTIELLRRGHQVYAVDTSRKALEILRKKCAGFAGLNAVNANGEQMPFEGEFFDGITSMFVAHYVDDIERYAREQFRVLRKGGIFIVSGKIPVGSREEFARSYEESLRRRGLLPDMQKEWDIFRENLLGGINRSSKNERRAEEVIEMLHRTGFREVEERQNPYFGQMYSLLARK